MLLGPIFINANEVTVYISISENTEYSSDAYEGYICFSWPYVGHIYENKTCKQVATRIQLADATAWRPPGSNAPSHVDNTLPRKRCDHPKKRCGPPEKRCGSRQL